MDKLTSEVGVRLSSDQKAVLDGLAEMSGISTSMLVRQLIEVHIEAKRQEYKALTELFNAPR